MAAKQISQETFDEVVKENIEDLEMSPEEAIDDARQQFEAQGVNLANIIQDPNLFQQGEGQSIVHPVVEATAQLKNLLQSEAVNMEMMADCCQTVERECNRDLAHRCLAAKHQCYDVLFTGLKKFETNVEGLKPVLSAFCALCNGQPDLIQEDCMDLSLKLLDRCSNIPDDVEVLVAKFIHYNCVMHETNRQTFIEKSLITKLVHLLEVFKDKPEVVKEVCRALRVLTNDDDPRVPFGKAHEHAKMIVMEADALKRILELCKAYTDDQAVLSELFATLSRLAVRNEFCQEILDLGGLKLMLGALQENVANQNICLQALKVLKAISGNDEVKVAIVRSEGPQIILATMTKHQLNSSISEMAAATITSIVLRAPEHCHVVMKEGAPEALVKTMTVHPTNAGVQKQCCMAIRNLVARTREHCPAFLEAGAETMITQALHNHKDCHDEAKASLRDLGCKVELIERWKGEGRKLAS